MTFVKFQGQAQFISGSSVHTAPFSLQPTALLSKQVSMRVGPRSGPFSRGLLGTWAQRILATPSSSAGNRGRYWEGD